MKSSKKLKITADILLVTVIFLALAITCWRSQGRHVFKAGIETTYAPWCYLHPKTGELVGSDIDIIREICRRRGWKAKFVSIDWEQKLELLNSGEIDSVWSCFTISNREKDYCCIGPLAHNSLVGLVLNDSPIHSFKDLEGKIVIVQSSTTSEDLFKDGAKYEKLVSGFKQLIAQPSVEQCFWNLKAKASDVFILDIDLANNYINDYPNQFRLMDTPFTQEEVGIGLRKGNTKLGKAISESLDQMQSDGTLERISLEHFGIQHRFCWGN